MSKERMWLENKSAISKLLILSRAYIVDLMHAQLILKCPL